MLLSGPSTHTAHTPSKIQMISSLPDSTRSSNTSGSSSRLHCKHILCTQFWYELTTPYFVNYCSHEHDGVRQLGLKTTLALLKGTTDQRRGITALQGFRAEIEKIRKSKSMLGSGRTSDAADVVTLANEILERWKPTGLKTLAR